MSFNNQSQGLIQQTHCGINICVSMSENSWDTHKEWDQIVLAILHWSVLHIKVQYTDAWISFSTVRHGVVTWNTNHPKTLEHENYWLSGCLYDCEWFLYIR